MTTAPSWMRPRGWFQVGWSAEVQAGASRTFPFFGHEVVLYRSSAGNLHALDAICLHLGAHLGHGGKVVDDCIVCPFHGWSWGPDGSNRDIPYSSSTKRSARSRRLRAWPTCEVNGVVFLWHHDEGKPPEWEMPDLFATLDDGDPCGTFLEPYPAGAFRYEALTIEPRVTAENIVDAAHFQTVHGSKRLPTLVDYEVTDATFRTKLLAHSRGKATGETNPKSDTVTLMSFGVGVSYTRFAGRDNTHGMFCATPIDAEHSTLYQTLWIEEKPGESAAQTADRLAAVASVYPEDLEIWQHQTFLKKPMLAREEAPLFGAMRRWCRQFEPTRVAS